jgi:putative glutamine amidotransferase
LVTVNIVFFIILALLMSPGTTFAASSSAAPVFAGPPVIGITGYADDEVAKGELPKFQTSMSYWKALTKAGAVVVRLLPADNKNIPCLLDRVDGVILCGGPDISPERYGEEPHPTVNVLSKLRENFDFALATEVLRRDMPVLGICLGSQMINVIRGGTLVQDIPSCVSKKVAHRPLEIEELSGPMHPVKLTRGSKLASFYDEKVLGVNSYHHQAVKKIGRNLAVAARSTGDGVIEGFVDPSARFLLGVQFHPELQHSPAGLHDKLFLEFVGACRKYRTEITGATGVKAVAGF